MTFDEMQRRAMREQHAAQQAADEAGAAARLKYEREANLYKSLTEHPGWALFTASVEAAINKEFQLAASADQPHKAHMHMGAAYALRSIIAPLRTQHIP